MTHVATSRAVDPDDLVAFSSLAQQVRDSEPCLELVRPPADAILYEPDAVLYAVCLADSLCLETDQRTRTALCGDALVIPPSLGIDITPRVDLVALRYAGTPPDHFRERFLQVWGFDHLPAPPLDAARQGRVDVIPFTDARFRIPYVIVDVSRTKDWDSLASDDLRIAVGLKGQPTVAFRLPGGAPAVALPPRHLLALPARSRCGVYGPGRVGVLTVLNEFTSASRRDRSSNLSGEAPSPEYTPPPAGRRRRGSRSPDGRNDPIVGKDF